VAHSLYGSALGELPKEGVKKLLVACPAFVSDCLETLEEIAKEGKEIFLHAGGESFTMIPCLNTHPLWVSAIAKWLPASLKGSKRNLKMKKNFAIIRIIRTNTFITQLKTPL
jgi:hypothetical protein